MKNCTVYNEFLFDYAVHCIMGVIYCFFIFVGK